MKRSVYLDKHGFIIKQRILINMQTIMKYINIKILLTII